MSRALPFFTSLFLFALGIAFCWLLWQSYQRVAPSYQWPEVQTTILESELEPYSPSKSSLAQFRINLVHQYEFEGEIYESSKIRPREKNFMRLADAEAEFAKYPLGGQFPAWVNPEAPSEAVLKRDSKAMLYGMAMPIFLVFLSLVGLYRSMFPQEPKKSSTQATQNEPSAQ